jgi:hypothetical protein
LLARDLGVRATIDVDLYRPQAAQSAEAQLRAAAQRDIGDWLRFEIGPAQPVIAGTTSRPPVTALVGATVWVSFHVDLAGGYRAEARRSLLTIARILDEATGIVRPFADPLLERTAAGHWEPAIGRWSG